MEFRPQSPVDVKKSEEDNRNEIGFWQRFSAMMSDGKEAISDKTLIEGTKWFSRKSQELVVEIENELDANDSPYEIGDYIYVYHKQSNEKKLLVDGVKGNDNNSYAEGTARLERGKKLFKITFAQISHHLLLIHLKYVIVYLLISIQLIAGMLLKKILFFYIQ